MRHIIVGTAGHIDHGKTALVERLTGVNTDRLPEEKKRGITIVLGFASLGLPSGLTVGLVDVPGHERFVKNMVAGAGGIDVVLLVVAADEGVMPQTREHLEICQLLQIPRAVVALTKIDKAGELAALAVDDVRASLAGTVFEAAPIVPCSAKTGEGIELLRTTLDSVAQEVPARSGRGPAFLPVDRCFTVKGFGAVVTGTLFRGQLAVGSHVEVLPPVMGRGAEEVRIRTLEVFKQSVPQAFAGQRTAINLQGVELDQLRVGQVLITPGAAVPTRRLSVRLTPVASRKKALPTGARALVHVGTAQIPVGITLLEEDALAPGQAGWATLRLSEPTVVLPGQHFILRGFDAPDQAGRTIGGGTILDPEPIRRRRRDPLALNALRALGGLREGGRLPEVAEALVEESGIRGATVSELGRRLGCTTSELERAVKGLEHTLLAGQRLVARSALAGLVERIVGLVEAFHTNFPFRSGMSKTELASRLRRRASAEIVALAVSRGVAEKKLVDDRGELRLPKHKPKLDQDPAIKARLIALLTEKPWEPPTAPELEAQLGLEPKSFRELLAALVKAGELVHVADRIYYEKRSFESARDRLLDHLARQGSVTTAEAKELWGLSRKYLIPLLETMDRLGVTVRVGEAERKAKVLRNS